MHLQVCRGCLGHDRLHQLNDETTTQFEACIPLQVSSDDGLPMLICQECIEILNISYSFQQKCIKTDTELKSYLNRLISAEINNITITIKDKTQPSLPDSQNENGDHCSLSEDISGCTDNEEDERKFEDNVDNLDVEFSPIKDNKKDISNQIIKLKNNEAFSCSFCKNKFQNKKIYLKHLKTHPEYKKFLCNYCAKSFRLSCTLEAHLTVHTGIRNYKCNKCSKHFKQRSGLSAHYRAFHTTERPFICDRCPSKFARKETLIVHQRTHDDVRPYICKTCGHSFSQMGNLAVHERIHTGEKPYKCKICNYRTAYSSQLKLHMYSHTGEKKCICPDCGKSFKNGSTLGRHRRIHTGDLPYKCSECPRAFIDAWKRSQHFKKNHQMLS